MDVYNSFGKTISKNTTFWLVTTKMKNRTISNGWLCKNFLAHTCPTQNVSNCRIFPFFRKASAQCKHTHNTLLFASLAFVRILFQMDLACCLTVNCNAIAPQRTMQFSSSICTDHFQHYFWTFELLLCKNYNIFQCVNQFGCFYESWHRQREKHCKLLERRLENAIDW